jgi:predicted unusual protein kinase regulating ubiquinone biosynthesis (AarF/ABC1/UbiB family)
MWWILFSELVRYVWTRNYPDFVVRVSERLMRQNLVYTKIFQGIVAKHAPCEMAHNIPYPPDEVAPTLTDGLTVGEVIGTGMVAVVFAGTAGGRPAVIKVKRKNIGLKLAAGLRDVGRTLAFVSRLPWVRQFSLLEVFEEVRDMILVQIDFEQEARNQKRFRAMFAYNPRIVVPELFEEWCTSDQLVMERLYGGPVEDCPDAAALLSQVIVKSVVLDGFVHADMHIGNVFFMKRGLGIVDYGLMTELTREQQESYITFSKFLMNEAYDEAAAYTLDTYFTRTAHRPDLVPKISAIFRSMKRRNVLGVHELAEVARVAYPRKMFPFLKKQVLYIGAADALHQMLSPNSLDLLLKNVVAFTE